MTLGWTVSAEKMLLHPKCAPQIIFSSDAVITGSVWFVFYIFWGFFNVHLCQGNVSQCCFFMYACVPPENPIVSVSGLTLWLTENPILLKEWLWLPCLVSCCANTHTVNLLFSVSLTPSHTYKSEPISYYSFPLLLSSLNPILLCTLILTPFPQHLAFVINVIYCDRD